MVTTITASDPTRATSSGGCPAMIAGTRNSIDDREAEHETDQGAGSVPAAEQDDQAGEGDAQQQQRARPARSR